jgi:FKBP-type peptidyl-prolyl cis-trans isomerase FkpA
MSSKAMKTKFILIIAILFSFVSCRSDQVAQKVPAKPGKQEMAEMNRYLVQKDREIIENYIERKNLKMTESPTGLWYYVKDDGNGEYLKDNDRIVMDYECSLLDGTVCYSSADLGPKEIILGRSDLESGMNEGLRLLKPGAEALFILPPFLAFGLVGDGKKIPPRTIIVYSVSILTEK